MLQFFSFTTHRRLTTLYSLHTYIYTQTRSARATVHYHFFVVALDDVQRVRKKCVEHFLGLRKIYTSTHTQAYVFREFSIHPDHHHHLHTHDFLFMPTTSTADFFYSSAIFRIFFPSSHIASALSTAASHFSRLVKVEPQRFLTVFCI